MNIKEKITEKIGFVNSQLKNLKIDLEEFSKVSKEDNKKRWILNSIKREVEEITETVIKINTIILKDKSIFPSSYRNSFLDLKDLNIFEIKELEELSKTAIFRNELAHEYMNLGEDEVILNSKEILKLYPKYLVKVLEFIEK